MEKLCKSELCTGCGACAAICPVGCISMETDEDGFLRPEVKTEKCVECGRCRKSCPILEAGGPVGDETEAYAAINADEQVRLSSTSGGIFSLLCQWVLERGGVVFGASYDEDFRVVHCRVENSGDLHKLRGAKYAQSSLGDSYRQVKSCLEEERYVLFSGTPCQVGGLLTFLGEGDEKLILVDLICHGVPSPKVWSHYVDYRSQRDACGQNPSHINLRSKETGWPAYSIQLVYPNGEVYSALNSQDPYLRGFVGNLYLRPSCYDCHFKGSTRRSDFTLGDYWGVWSQLPEYHDGKGTSLVLMHTEKSKTIWSSISPWGNFSAVDVSMALKDNPSALVSSHKSEKREEFLDRYQKDDFSVVIDELCPKPIVTKQSVVQRIARKIRRILRV